MNELNHRAVAASAAIATVFAVGLASAETVAWYHFDEQSPGVRATCAANAIKDSVGNYNGQVKTACGAVANTSSEGTDESLAPYYCRPPRVYDPIGGKYLENKAALLFSTSGSKTSSTHKGSLTGAVVRVASFLPGKPFGSVTVEAVVYVNPISYDVFMPIVAFWSSESGSLSEYWSLLMTESGRVAARFAYDITDGMTGESYSKGTHKINDGRWHHVALVHDAAEGSTFRIYVDGELDATYTKDKKASTFINNAPLYIGGMTINQAARKFDGVIDEVRISDEALETNDFLRVEQRKDYPIDDDTYVYVPFETPLTKPSQSFNMNVVANGPAFNLKPSNRGNDCTNIPPATMEYESASTNMAGGLFATDAWTDEQACHLKTTANHNGSACYGGSNAYLTKSWTAEIFFKSDSSSSTSRDILRCGVTTAPCLRVMIAKHLYFHYNNYDESSGTYKIVENMIGGSDEFNDGCWHHIAAIYDRDARLMRLYIDYRLRHVGENVNLESKNYYFFLGANPTGDNSCFLDGWMDEFRLTRRALNVDDLIHPLNPFDADRDTYLEASFEKDWKVRSGWGKLLDATPITAEGETVTFFDASDGGRLAGDFVWTNSASGGAVCRENHAAASLGRGYIGFPELPYREVKNFTAEMFVKLQSIDNQACLLRMAYGTNPSYTSDSTIIGIYATGKDVGNKLSCRVGLVNTEYATNVLAKASGTQWLTFDFSKSGKNLLDGKWHHVAMVFENAAIEPTEENPSTESTAITLYVDYKQVDKSNVVKGYHLPFKSMHSPKPRLSIGTGVGTPAPHFTGMIDEVRLTTRALVPDEFLTMTRRPRGLMMLVQ